MQSCIRRGFFQRKNLLSDSNFDDWIIELMKLSVSGLIERENHVPVYRILLEETAGNMLEFTAMLGDCAQFEYITVKAPANITHSIETNICTNSEILKKMHIS